MKLFKLYLFTCMLVVLGCTSPEPSTNVNVAATGATGSASVQPESEKQMAFRQFLQKFKVLSLPLNMDDAAIQSTNGLRKIKIEDTAFISTDFPEETWCYGILPDTSKMYQLIWLMPYAEYVPMLTTFTKSGERISRKQLGVGECGSDCCFTCREFVRIEKDMTIYSADSIKSCICDDEGPIESTTKEYVRYFTGKILDDGTIYTTDVAEKVVGR